MIKNNLLKLAFILLLFAVNGCDGVSEDKLVGRYYLGTVDYVDNGMSLYFKLDDNNSYGVVNETVFAVGYNDKYIIVKQHPAKFPNPPNKAITNYFIVSIYNENTLWAEKGVIGPLTLEQFKAKRKELGISDSLTFTKVFKDLE